MKFQNSKSVVLSFKIVYFNNKTSSVKFYFNVIKVRWYQKIGQINFNIGPRFKIVVLLKSFELEFIFCSRSCNGSNVFGRVDLHIYSNKKVVWVINLKFHGIF